MEGEEKKKLKTIVVGGTIAGLLCAHALISAGCEVTVIEKSMSPPAGSPTGVGLSIEPQAREVIDWWLDDPSILHDISFPLGVELMCPLDGPSLDHTQSTTIRHNTLGPPDDKASVKIEVEVLQTNEIKDMVAHLLIPADGSLSLIRQHFLPDHELRYSGYSAWRGVSDFQKMKDQMLLLA